MNNNLKSQEELEVEKIKVTKAEIVVRGTVDKPYYVIVYHEAGKDYDNEGFGSYYLENVFKWRDEELEIVDENEQLKTDWIPFNEPPKEDDTYIVAWLPIGLDCMARTKHYYALWDFENDEWEVDVPESYKNFEIICIAYQPLPAPYKKEGAE